jgi:hypothetical protein
MGKSRKEGRKKKSRKSVLKTLKMIKNNEKLINEYKEQKN